MITLFRRGRLTVAVLSFFVVLGIVFQAKHLQRFVNESLLTPLVGSASLLLQQQPIGSSHAPFHGMDETTTTGTGDRQLPVALHDKTLQLTRVTSQHQSRRNNSRLLCGALPNSSPKAISFPTILSSTTTTQCRHNAILYMVQKGKHSSYNRNSTALFLKSLDLLYQNYLSIDHHYDNVDVLIFHSGDYTLEDLRLLDSRYNSTVHFKLIDLNNTEYWTIPEVVRHDNISAWAAFPMFGVGYRHMIRWYALKLYDFVRDYADPANGGCNYNYLMRMDEDSFLYSPIRYDLFEFMQMHNYTYSFRMCAYEMEMNVWDDYVDHIHYCGNSLPPGVPVRTLETGLCGFYNNFFILQVDFILQPQVQHFLQWTDATGIMYRERYNDLQIQTIAVYAFAPPERIHRFLDWTYEHMTLALSQFGLMCPIWGAIQAGYLDEHVDATLLRFAIESNMNRKKCPPIRKQKVFREMDMSPTYSHLPPPSSWWNDTFGMPRSEFQWKTFAAGSVESPYRGDLSG